MGAESGRGSADIGVVVPNEAFEVDPSLKDHINQVVERIGRDLKAHLPKN